MKDVYAFEVPAHEQIIAMAPGKMPHTVLTIEAQIFNVRVCEYSDPLFIGRSWDYGSLDLAVNALATYLSGVGAEPSGWDRAIDFENGYRVRRTKVVNGQRIVVEMGPDGFDKLE